MFQRIIEDFKDGTGTAVRMTSIAALVGFALLVTIAFLSAAAFIAVQQAYGSIQACLTVAGIFLVIALIAAAVYSGKKRDARLRAERAAAAAREAAKSAASSMLADPMLLAAGLQVVRAVGLKKLIPLLAIGGVALGFLMSRNAATAADGKAAESGEE